MIEQKSFKTILADEGKKLLINDSLHDEIIVALNSKPQIQEVEVPDYIGNASTLGEIKDIMILKSKANLAQYLEDNPLFSKCKYADGRYYNITKEKQDQLTSTLASYMSDILPQLVIGMSTAQVAIKSVEEFLLTLDNLPQTITWNDTGGICEVYSYKELYTLKCEIMARVKPLVSIQQTMEVAIQNTEIIQDVLKISVEFTEENMAKYTHGVDEGEAEQHD